MTIFHRNSAESMMDFIEFMEIANDDEHKIYFDESTPLASNTKTSNNNNEKTLSDVLIKTYNPPKNSFGKSYERFM